MKITFKAFEVHKFRYAFFPSQGCLWGSYNPERIVQWETIPAVYCLIYVDGMEMQLLIASCSVHVEQNRMENNYLLLLARFTSQK